MTLRPARPAFTLLEVLLAAAIGVLLMSALYVAVEVQLRRAQDARDIVEQSTLARALLHRMAADVRPTLAPPLPLTTSSSSSPAATPAAGGTGTTTPAAGGTTTGGATGTTSPTPPAASSTTPTPTPTTQTGVQINLGVQGDANRLVVTGSMVPREWSMTLEEGVTAPLNDQHRVVYALIGDGEMPLGLARQVVRVLTSEDESNALLPDVAEPQRYLIAEEVKGLTFRYFDGSSWVDSWDSTAPGSDGTTPIGPPPAIEIVIGVLPVGKPNTTASLKYYRHVVAIPTANGTTTSTGN